MQRESIEWEMDKSLKRHGSAPSAQGSMQQQGNGPTAIGNNSRFLAGGGGNGGSPARASGPAYAQSNTSAGTRTTNQQRGQNRSNVSSTQPRGGNQREIKTGKNGGNFKGGNQPQGLGSFRELGLNSAEQGSRKHNYNHLLNFNYGHRGEQYMGRYGLHRRYTQDYYQPRYNKELFLQATCQFIVKDKGDYAVHHIDPDVLVEWKNIELVKVYSHEIVNCPICLHPPVAAKMTRCGHVYCWPCILHYLSLSDANYRKCPICYESVYGADLKSAVVEVVAPVKIGSEITMRLMMREKGSVWPRPVSQWEDRGGLFYNIKDLAALNYSKFLLVRDDQLHDEILAREEHELLFALETERDNPESCFIEKALEFVQQRRPSWTRTLPAATPLPVDAPTVVNKTVAAVHIAKPSKVYADAFFDEPVRIRPNSFNDEFSGDFGVDLEVANMLTAKFHDDALVVEEKEEPIGDIAPIDGGSLGSNDGQRRMDIRPLNNVHYFYQSADGQNVYLNHLNVRMLVAEYGHISAAPQEITAKVLDLETWSVTEEVRKRYRYLSHLPLTCVFNIVEVDLKEPYLSHEVMYEFDKESQQRQHVRRMKQRDELNRQQEAENAFRKDIRGQISFSMQSELFPSFERRSSREDLNIASEEAFPAVGTEVAPSLPVTTLSEPPTPSTSASKSFAQMLREGKIRAAGASQATASSTSTSPVSQGHLRGHSSEDDQDAGDAAYHPPPNFQASFSASLDAAFGQLKMKENNESSGGKKKNKNKVTLFTTGGVPRV